jgi:uncharacterized protein
MRLALTINALSAAMLGMTGLASAAPMHCARARDDVEQAICARPALLAKDSAIAARLDVLKQQCPSLRQELVRGQKFWLGERWDCRNQEGAFSTPDGLPACLAQRMTERQRHLDAVDRCDMTALRASYRMVDADYMLAHSAPYVGKTVSVSGVMLLASCKTPGAPSTEAAVQDLHVAHARFRVQFRSMPPSQRDFLCSEAPFSHWKGEVRHDAQGDYLYLSDVLGAALPPP